MFTSAITVSLEHPCTGGYSGLAFTKGLAYAFHFYGQIGMTRLLTQVGPCTQVTAHLVDSTSMVLSGN
jgi:hypothetical protein